MTRGEVAWWAPPSLVLLPTLPPVSNFARTSSFALARFARRSLAPRTKQVKKRVKGKWTFPKSLFADYQQDSEEYLNKCFEFDYR